MAIKGGSGKEYEKHPDGTITVSRPDGTQSSISPGEPGYAATNNAMKDDTGSNKPTHNNWGASGGKEDSTQGNNRPAGSNINTGSSSSSSSSSGSSSGSSSSTSRPKQPAQYVDPDNPGKGATTTIANIYNEKGELVSRVEVILKDGACYNKDTGQIMSDKHLNELGGGTHNQVDWIKDWKDGESYWRPVPRPNRPSGGGSSGGSGGGWYPSTPPPPPFIEFDEPMPTFNSDLKKLNKYTYFFGIDDMQLRHVSLNPTCCFISKSIELGTLDEGEYIELDASYSADENSSIEFYIIDGTNEIPIVPIKDTLIKNEKVFTGYETRFKVDKSKQVIVKRDGVTTNVSLDEALLNNQNYVLTYTPDGGYQYKPFHTTIKVKIIIRNYKLENYAPCVLGGMKIRKYAKGGLWT